MVSLTLIFSAFFAGLLTFLAPCTLPLVPGYLAFISGVPQADVNDPSKRAWVRRRIFLNGLFFILGFTAIFVVFGSAAGFIGQNLAEVRIWMTRIGGLFVILFGLFMLGVLRIPFLQSERRVRTPRWLTVGKPSSSFLIGGAFAFGWSPCIGPVLGSILLLASTSATVLEGALLLLVFSFGLAIPFLLVAASFSHAAAYITVISRYLKWVSVIGGVFLIFLGVLLLTGNFNLLITWGFEFFGFLEYDAILQHL
ncbi:cytochrome C biogenesis protein [Candidatus Kaiserbacteria bacterium CG10_big_fil_rev_8_21_14_0_10_49_17]|uniref:Cytochrome C biogenesis protein n=1 Tax=Candidatus Kaiserbacteria bacterium CG10_big_fil_rev_8_21_14_0_10_49_17 TaxID=1974609 RepID=A0A2M6WDM3_9BACT|nr:MAG: cytochrome C biogenesis protein [Candidatus Kaiserbacteria bacterium CG10_big_fil_rev_8_21_14_0_10_49_17]